MANLKSKLFSLIIIVLIGYILWDSTSNDGPPIPNDEDHTQVKKLAECVECHDFEAMIKENKKHPPKVQCLLCHVLGE